MGDKNKYKAVLFSIDGDWVTDFKGETIEDVYNQIANKGSLWFFYPLYGIIELDGNLATEDYTSPSAKIIDSADQVLEDYGYFPSEFFVNKTIGEVSRELEKMYEEYQKKMEEEKK